MGEYTQIWGTPALLLSNVNASTVRGDALDTQ